MPSTGPDPTRARPDVPRLSVACGVLQRADGKVLLTQRPSGKLAEGRWEFPGGKLEAGEVPLQALVRELEEELGVELTRARRLLRLRHDYRDRIVDLDTWLVYGFEGQPESREGQRFAWLDPDEIARYDVLPTVAPILSALRLPLHYVMTPPDMTPEQVLAGIPALPPGALLRLRLPQLSDAAYDALASSCIEAAAPLGLKLILNRDPARVAALGAAGWHATEAALAAHASRPIDEGGLVIASVHDEAAISRAVDLGVDAIVVGNVWPTPSHPGRRGLGWDGFERLIASVACPAYAIGGIGPQDLDQAHAAGAQGVAGIRAYWLG